MEIERCDAGLLKRIKKNSPQRISISTKRRKFLVNVFNLLESHTFQKAKEKRPKD